MRPKINIYGINTWYLGMMCWNRQWHDHQELHECWHWHWDHLCFLRRSGCRYWLSCKLNCLVHNEGIFQQSYHMTCKRNGIKIIDWFLWQGKCEPLTLRKEQHQHQHPHEQGYHGVHKSSLHCRQKPTRTKDLGSAKNTYRLMICIENKWVGKTPK